MFWPFDSGWYISGLDLFRQTRRNGLLTWPVFSQNLLAMAQELAILGPIALALWLSTCKSPGPICAREVPPRPSGAVADTAVYFGSPKPSCSTLRIARQMSRPMKSAASARPKPKAGLCGYVLSTASATPFPPPRQASRCRV